MATRSQTPNQGVESLILSNETVLITAETTPKEMIEITDNRVGKLWSVVKSPSNNPRMMLPKEKQLVPCHEVYRHYDKEDNWMYVGTGFPGRSLDALSRRSCTEHARWLLQQMLDKNKCVEVIEDNLTEEQAKTLEKKLIELHQPKFNKVGK